MPKDELAIAYDEGKVIGIPQNTGGITEYLDEIIEMVNKQTGAIVSYNSDPDQLMMNLKPYTENRSCPDIWRR